MSSMDRWGQARGKEICQSFSFISVVCMFIAGVYTVTFLYKNIVTMHTRQGERQIDLKM